MQLITKPEPTETYFKLSAREASLVAMKVSKSHSARGEVDWGIFREWTEAWRQRNSSKNLTLA